MTGSKISNAYGRLLKERQVEFLEGENGGQSGEEYLRIREMYPAPIQCPTKP